MTNFISVILKSLKINNMKKAILLSAFCASIAIVFAQKQTYDLVSYTAPKNWVKEVKAGTYTSYTIQNNQKTEYCRIFILASISSKGNIKDDFESEWKNSVASVYEGTSAPQITGQPDKNGWKSKTGMTLFTFNNAQGVVILTTLSGYNKVVSIVSVTNTQSYNNDIANFLASIEMKKPSAINQITQTTFTPASNSRFTFTTTNFDDGWVATQQADWVEASKGNTKVLIHFPNKQADAYNSVVLDGLKNAWDILIAPRYSSASNFEFKPITGWQTIEFAEADLVEKGSNKKVHVVLFKMNYSNGSGRYLEFISPDKRAFEQVFGPYHQTTSGWENMEKMADYNKFAVAAADLRGKWTSDFSGAIQYVNAYTGFDSHMDTHASAENFIIGNNNTYNWEISVASGAVGNIKFQSKKSSGNLSMNGNWKVNFSDIEGRARSYDTYFTCIKGLRILWLDNRPFAKAE
jgi:hypothetical protein